MVSESKVSVISDASREFNQQVLREYISFHDFKSVPFDRALRIFLSKFKMPGEAQQIDRMMELFAQVYCIQNPIEFSSPGSIFYLLADSAYILAFSLIMLNTDLHNPQVKHKISKSQFIKNNKGIDCGNDLPEKFLSVPITCNSQSLYDSIMKEEIKLNSRDGRFETVYTFYNPEKEGFLIKRGGRIRTWKKRWCILTGGCFYYFRDVNVLFIINDRILSHMALFLWKT